MATVFIRHRVADNSAWKPIYDADLPRRNAAGLKEIGVYRETSDENMLLVIFEVENPEVINEQTTYGISTNISRLRITPTATTQSSLRGHVLWSYQNSKNQAYQLLFVKLP